MTSIVTVTPSAGFPIEESSTEIQQYSAIEVKLEGTYYDR